VPVVGRRRPVPGIRASQEEHAERTAPNGADHLPHFALNRSARSLPAGGDVITRVVDEELGRRIRVTRHKVAADRRALFTICAPQMGAEDALRPVANQAAEGINFLRQQDIHAKHLSYL